MKRAIPLTFFTLGYFAMTAASDEGMWPVNEPPRAQLKDRYGFQLSDSWLKRTQFASVRFTNGGSGGFVSPNGLIVTNHHIGADALQKLLQPGRDLLKDGYLAKTQVEEIRAPDLELNVLHSIEDVTARVDAAVKPGMTPADAFAVRRSVTATIEKESFDKTGLRSDVVSLYQGGLSHLYRYKKYTDVRLVFAPESAAAGFGGDVDNFEYPRYGFDVCFFRAYENGAPAKIEHYFPWANQAPADGDLVFVTGHPGTTNRMETVAKLLYRRDRGHPYALARLRAVESLLTQFSERGPEERRAAVTDLYRVANSRKAFAGQYQGLLDPKIIARKEIEEAGLRGHDASAGSAWDQVAAAQLALAEFERPFALFERGDAFHSELFSIARHLLRLAEELPKPNGLRLREYRDSAMDSLKLQLFSPAPIDARLERAKLAGSFTFMAEQLGAGHPLVAKVLAQKTPEARADEIVSRCTLASPAARQTIFDGGPAAIAATTDPMIALSRLIDPDARKLRTRFETEVEEPERQGYAKIAKVRFAALGRNVAPDATFTLRLAFGRVSGYEVDGASLPFFTTLGGLFERAEKQGFREPFAPPPRWREGRTKLNLGTPLNFTSTADTIGGNSGSPVLNRAGELVGINFDRNRHGLVRNFVYTDVQARHVSVHGLAVLEALDKLYGANELIRELKGP